LPKGKASKKRKDSRMKEILVVTDGYGHEILVLELDDYDLNRGESQFAVIDRIREALGLIPKVADIPFEDVFTLPLSTPAIEADQPSLTDIWVESLDEIHSSRSGLEPRDALVIVYDVAD